MLGYFIYNYLVDVNKRVKMNYIALGITGSIIIAGIIILSLISLMWLNKKETVLKKKVKTVEQLYPGVPFKQKVEPVATSPLNKNLFRENDAKVEEMRVDTNKENVVRSNNHVKHPYKRKRKK